MNFDITLKTKTPDSFRKSSIISQFDLQADQTEENFTGNLELEDIDWNIGIIVGPSGTGKTTIAKKLFGDYIVSEYKWTDNCILDDMPKDKSVKEISKTFNIVGFSSPPSWLKPFKVLSNGEQMRVMLARAILEKQDMFAFDEFTSVVDRQVAKVGSFAMQKAIRKQDKKFVAIACHYDIIDWLQPDWVFDTETMSFFLIKQKDQILKSILENATKQYGKSLESITI